jgi:hypothetical protein
MIRQEHNIDVMCDWLPSEHPSTEYLAEHAVTATVRAEWAEDESEDYVGGNRWHTVRFMRLHEWSTVQIRLDGVPVNANAVPDGFPMADVIALLDSYHVRDELERQGPGGMP